MVEIARFFCPSFSLASAALGMMLFFCCWQGENFAEELPPEDGDDSQPPSLKSSTLGGRQFWADQLVFRGWRIQRNVVTGHHRLLDSGDRRRAWGTFDQCQARLAQAKREPALPPQKGRGVVLLHGLFRTRKSLDKLGDYLHEHGGYEIINVGYPTTRGSVEDHAKDFAKVIGNLDDLDEINLVAHSLGNLVIRHWWADQTGETSGETPDPRIKRIVMLAPPNQQPELAGRLVPLDFSRQLTGAAAWQLAREWDQLAGKLATPRCQFGILAGGSGRPSGRNPLIAGDDDLVVSVKSTRLAGARDFRLLPVWHTTLMNDARVQEQTLRFLQHGYFESEETRQPIEE